MLFIIMKRDMLLLELKLENAKIVHKVTIIPRGEAGGLCLNAS